MSVPTSDSLEQLRVRLAQFASARDWDQFHTPKNLAMALAGEAGELLEHFQWLTPEQSGSLPPEKQRPFRRLQCVCDALEELQIL